MFMGEYQHTIDSKGRVIIPARFREQLGERFVIALWLDKCLMMVSQDEWQRICLNLQQLSSTKKDSRAFTRMLFSSASECECDKQGRVLITSKLRSYAILEKNVSFIGVSNRVEIWSSEIWQGYSEQAEADFVNSAEKLGDIVF
ncbi:division/cell wall cluster transcriptional repressor MraZ [Clostridium sp. 'deep sea']|uniref:division/cell wall cluster transcriptional repressor MraZ n=1 Tax=Clostridium sp. 'deep sea' TaxID=2779445 RepID=UPI0018966CEA|nr:division/cell wall cluster transcriptional repressor MraZ [Clostridium sp. 'deep sea']QOR36943.1 division/cell wall cluster transcriptional repressor MraZ [Clostridium sp. 'deep sea']